MQVLDQGYVTLIETWGSDERIIEAARMSTGKGFQGWGYTTKCNHTGECIRNPDSCTAGKKVEGDEKLLAYLYNNKHSTPFEMAGMIIEVKAPIFVFREWHRHRTQSYNEMSARYIPLPDDNYIPTIERLMMNSSSNKQAQGSKELSKLDAEAFRMRLAETYSDIQLQYEAALEAGVPKELARLVVPVGRYSRMRASANLRNWLGFLTLRDAPNAQWEIQQYAKAVAALVAEHFPRTYELYVKERNS